ncbi:MAG: AAA family ATPase, partial [Clostridia bacterium]|nr:AAA family ATPase [Clostridia bacterium]
MILTGWHVEGFGILRDHRVEGLGPGLVLVTGPNEAGKSTLLAFLRFVLFGPDREEPSREALRGGRLGGRLFCADGDGRVWVVERFGGRAARRATVFPAGSVAGAATGAASGEEVLARLLGGADGRVFRSVFAFGLEELSRFKTLTDAGVQERIFSAGITGAGAAASRARQALEAEAGRLLRPRAGGVINDLVAALREARESLRAAREAAARYPQVLANLERAAADVQRLGAEAECLEQERRLLETLLDLWQPWNAWRLAKEALDAMP